MTITEVYQIIGAVVAGITSLTIAGTLNAIAPGDAILVVGSKPITPKDALPGLLGSVRAGLLDEYQPVAGNLLNLVRGKPVDALAMRRKDEG